MTVRVFSLCRKESKGQKARLSNKNRRLCVAAMDERQRTEVAAFAENERQKSKPTNAGIHPRLDFRFLIFRCKNPYTPPALPYPEPPR